MPNKCCVPGCRGNYDSDNKVHVFSFPRNEEAQAAWMRAIRRKDFMLTKNSRVCEKHFTAECIEWIASGFDYKTNRLITAPLKKPRLHSSAIPTIFPDLPACISKDASSTRKSSKHRKRREENQQALQTVMESLKSKHEYDDLRSFKDFDELQMPLMDSMHQRKRTENFTVGEKELLLEIIMKRIDIIQNKKTDSVTVRAKEEVWQEITDSFNAQTTHPRTVAHLKTCWENLKKRCKKHSEEKVTIIKTGAGKYCVIQSDPLLDKVKDLLSLSLDDLHNPYDSDALCNKDINGHDESIETDEEQPYIEDPKDEKSDEPNSDEDSSSSKTASACKRMSTNRNSISNCSEVEKNGDLEDTEQTKSKRKKKEEIPSSSESITDLPERLPAQNFDREDIFGQYVASEIRALRDNPLLYLQTKQSILEILTSANFELINPE